MTHEIDSVINVSLPTVLGAPFLNSSNRGLMINSNGSLVLSNYDSLSIGLLSSSLLPEANSKITFSSNGINGIYASCQLPNGNYIAGADQWSGSKANEYLPNGDFVRSFNTTQQWSFSSCAPISSTKVAWVDYDGGTDQNGDIVLSTLSGGVWSETARYLTNTNLSSLPNSMWYAIVSHTNGNLYAFPFVGGTNRNKKILKCSLSGNLSDCQLVGPDLKNEQFNVDVIQGAAQLPNRVEIVFASNDRFIYFFNPNDNSVELKADISPFVPDPGCCEIRGIAVGPESL